MKKVLVSIGGRLWAVWTLIVFIPTLLIFVWPILGSFYVKEPLGMRIFRISTQIWMQIFLHIIGCPLTIYGKQYHQKGKNYVVVCNHSSLMDVPLITPFFPGANKTIAKKSISKVPIFGWVYTRGSVLVERNNDASRRKSYEDMKKVLLEESIDMAIYPEGTRNRTQLPLKEFYDGAFRLAIDCKKDIIPVVMFHTATVLPAGKPFFVWPHALQMHLLPPISYENKTIAELKQEAFTAMWAFISNHPASNKKG